ncbi:DUF1822 family protein [Leptolyngbya sp. DQ-M1]|uniref:DUF1822 family protein n=1 Tax=Leptolyngbya sp. DQ-M1 TaxID=2933920 RepID=UPI003299CE1C
MDSITQLELQISAAIDHRAWQHSQRYSMPKAQWTAYLNQVCLETVLPWLQAEYASRSTASLTAWDLIQGCAIEWNEKRLVLIPEKSFDTSELRVPQEWIDVPSWVGDYYLAVQINPDESSLRIWGYTTHAQIKALGQYDSSDRAYSLNAQFLVQDMAVLWVMRQLYPTELTRVEVTELPSVAETQAENLLQRLATVEQPRLEIPFTMWGSLLETRSWRERLHQLRQGRNPNTTVATNLRQWLENSFTAGWSAIEAWLNPEELAFSFRQTEIVELTGVRRVKPLEFAEQTVLLMLALAPEADGRVSIRVQLRPAERSQCLPMGLSLSLVSASGDVVQSVQAREQDNSIQLQRFKCPAGTEFSLQVALGNAVLTEAFQC